MAHYNPAEKAGYAGTGVWISSRMYDDYDVEFLDSFPGDPTANEGRVAHVRLVPKVSVIAKNEAIQVPEDAEHGLLRTSQ